MEDQPAWISRELTGRKSPLQQRQSEWRMRKGTFENSRNCFRKLQLDPNLDKDHELRDLFEDMFDILDHMNDALFIEQGGKLK